jgi:hypothetical protein
MPEGGFRQVDGGGHVPPEQAPVEQTLPQPPQLFESVDSFTQAPLQSVNPALQATAQVPAVQDAPAAFGSVVVHTLPQAPQLFGSDSSLTHAAPHADKPALHVGTVTLAVPAMLVAGSVAVIAADPIPSAVTTPLLPAAFETETSALLEDHVDEPVRFCVLPSL